MRIQLPEPYKIPDEMRLTFDECISLMQEEIRQTDRQIQKRQLEILSVLTMDDNYIDFQLKRKECFDLIEKETADIKQQLEYRLQSIYVRLKSNGKFLIADSVIQDRIFDAMRVVAEIKLYDVNGLVAKYRLSAYRLLTIL